MSTQSNNTNITFGGLFPLLAVLFIGLKLTHYITWPWIWVLAPIWGPLALVLSIFLVWALAVVLVGVVAILVRAFQRRR